MDREYKIKKFEPSVPSSLTLPCPYCRKIPDFHFMISSEIWYKVIHKKYWRGVVCLRCFDILAQRKKIDWIPHLKYLWFCNKKVSIKLTIKDVFFNHKNRKEEWMKN